MVRAVCWVALCALGLLGACSGKTITEDDGSGGESSAPSVSPSKKCEAYAKTWCSKSFGCYAAVGRIPEADRQKNVDKCYQIIVDRLPCSEVASVGSDYDKCISQIGGMACSKWDVPTSQFGTIVPPSSCDAALSF